MQLLPTQRKAYSSANVRDKKIPFHSPFRYPIVVIGHNDDKAVPDGVYMHANFDPRQKKENKNDLFCRVPDIF